MTHLLYRGRKSTLITELGAEIGCARPIFLSHRTAWQKVNLRSKETADSLKAYLRLSRKQKIGILCGVVVGSACFVTYQVWTLGKRLKVTGNVHEIEREREFFYPKQPLKLKYEDVFSEDIKRRVDYNIEKAKRKIIPWAQSKTRDPAILLKLAESKDPDIRRRGLRALITDNDWEDFQYRMVAQACSNQTMVSLARIPNSDYRLFRPMPWLPPPKETVESALRSLLAALQKEGVDNGIKQFTDKVLLEGKPKNIVETGQWNFGGTPLEYVKSLSDETDGLIEIFCLEALVNHTFRADQCMKIVELGGLQIMQRVYLDFHKSVVIRRLIAWILANMSLNINLHKAIIEGGWVAVLHRWLESSDTALFFHTARALANLDRDWKSENGIQAFYEDGVYLAYPVHKIINKKEKVKTDIVFVHGLMGGPFKTWRQEDRRHTEKDFVVTDDFRRSHTFFWPKDWLAKDVHNLRLLNVGYQTELTTWDTRHPLEAEKRTLSSRSMELLEKLERADIGNRPVIWVGHSMGGLLIKEILNVASMEKRFSKVLDNTIGVVFYSVPHRGSALAKISNRAKYMVFPSIEVQELNEDNEKLMDLQKRFLHLHEQYDIPVLSFGETEKTSIKMNMKVHVVPPESSGISILPGTARTAKDTKKKAQAVVIYIPRNHVCACKIEKVESPQVAQHDKNKNVAGSD
ncbi:protein SERAC1-like isoform X2 [Mercenaria mercenaria]|uniref:protein SERAC1-like isoform X2 n=1 Tax=Mercenaria mercenaria TaxID=6596 RepID=UPI00234F7797|nr:protein SERAC1-like isoform X2 [Mercenaria mercenaria]